MLVRLLTFAFICLLLAGNLAGGFATTQQALLLAVAQLAQIMVFLNFQSLRQRLDGISCVIPSALFVAFILWVLTSSFPLGNILGNEKWHVVTAGRGAASLDPLATRMAVIEWLGLAAVFVAGLVIAAERADGQRAFRWLGYACLGHALLVFLDFTASLGVLHDSPRVGQDRLTAGFGSANTAGTLMASYMLLGLLRALREWQRMGGGHDRGRVVFRAGMVVPLLLVLVSASCLFLTGSRGAILSAASATLVAILMMVRVVHVRWPLAAIAGGILWLASTGDVWMDRLGQSAASADMRRQIYMSYLAVVERSPVTGYGAGSFEAYNAMAMNAGNGALLSYLRAVHNVYLQLVLETGLVGAALMIGCILAIALHLVRGFSQQRRGRMEILSALMVLLIFAVHGLSDYALQIPSLAAFLAFVLGLGYGLATAERPTVTFSKSHSHRRSGDHAVT